MECSAVFHNVFNSMGCCVKSCAGRKSYPNGKAEVGFDSLASIASLLWWQLPMCSPKTCTPPLQVPQTGWLEGPCPPTIQYSVLGLHILSGDTISALKSDSCKVCSQIHLLELWTDEFWQTTLDCSSTVQQTVGQDCICTVSIYKEEIHISSWWSKSLQCLGCSNFQSFPKKTPKAPIGSVIDIVQ